MSNDQTIKTGTTCIGFRFKDGVLLGADMRVTTYKIEGDSFTKIFDISSHSVATIAGQASAAQLFMRVLKGEVRLIELKTERKARVSEIAAVLNTMQYGGIRSQGSLVSCILGGYDDRDGLALYDMSFDGTMSSHENYLSTGSGSLYAKAVLDTEYKDNMAEKEALELVEKCFKAAFKNDNASGGGYVIKIITKDGIKDAQRKVAKTELVSEVK